MDHDLPTPGGLGLKTYIQWIDIMGVISPIHENHHGKFMGQSTINADLNIPSIDWFKGKFTGTSQLSWENFDGFRLRFSLKPINGYMHSRQKNMRALPVSNCDHFLNLFASTTEFAFLNVLNEAIKPSGICLENPDLEYCISYL